MEIMIKGVPQKSLQKALKSFPREDKIAGYPSYEGDTDKVIHYHLRHERDLLWATMIGTASLVGPDYDVHLIGLLSEPTTIKFIAEIVGAE